MIPVDEGGTRLEAGAAQMPSKQLGANRLRATGRRRRKRGERHGTIANEPFSDEHPNPPELNLREKFAEVRRRLGYVQKRGTTSGITTAT